MKLINTMESAVATQLCDLKMNFPNACFCDRCQQDIMAVALNSLPPRYVVSEEGEVYARIAELRQQYHADIIVALIEAIDKVQKHPRHD